jgi:pyruvate,water dikinase
MSGIVELADAADVGRAELGGKAAVLAQLAAAGLAVPPGVVVTAQARDDPRLGARLVQAATRLGVDRFAVRSSAVAEDLPDASYAGLYETYLNVTADHLADAVPRCFAAATTERVRAYHDNRGGTGAGMAVLVQVMVDPVAAGVAFTAHPVTGDRDTVVVTAVAGLGDPLVSGETTGEEWTVTRDGVASMTRPGPGTDVVLAAEQATAVAALARAVADRYGQPQDVEWAIDHNGRLWLLQARPMTALPEPVSWNPPGRGQWMRNFRLGEWLPEAVTPLFATWLLPRIEDGYLDGMAASVGVKVLFNALVRVGRNPAGADRAVLSDLHRRWHDDALPRYRQLVATAEADVDTAGPRRLIALVDQLGRQAGIALWYLAIVGGSAWKMEARLTRFTRRHLGEVLPERDGGAQVLLRGLPDARPGLVPHAVQSIDWYHPVAGELPTAPAATGKDRHDRLAAQRTDAEHRCTTALAHRPRLLTQFRSLLAVNQRYAVIREQQARDLTLAWPVLRTCALRLGRHLTDAAVIAQLADVFFCIHTDLDAALDGQAASLATMTAERRATWQRQRRLAAPLTLGRPLKPIGDVIARAVQQARGTADIGSGVLVGHPASAGRATGPVHIVNGPEDFAGFTDGDVLVAKATAPAWTPLFARAAAVVTDGGTHAAHASLVAREYGIPAVVATGDATHRLRPGQLVTVDGTAGTVTLDGARMAQ